MEMDVHFDTTEFRRALGSFLTGVTIVTTARLPRQRFV
jgi:flavin reductase (DIM6/NTAB) family NADH-FMN oxidoreductase RutF